MTDKQLTRIYTVTERDAKGHAISERLVRASSQAQAIRHVVDPRFTASVPSPDELVRLTLADVKIEDAKA